MSRYSFAFAGHRRMNAWRRPISRDLSGKTGLLFPGQGSQFVGMGSDLYTQFVTARTVIDECDAILQKKLKSLMFNGPAKALTATQIAQPAIVCHSIALLRVFESECGFKVSDCELALGHSLGEYSVLVATESIRFEEAIKLVHLRGKSMQFSVEALEQKTAMKALIIQSEHLEDVEAIIKKLQSTLPPGEVAEIANINSRSQIVLSGTAKGVEYATSVIHSRGYSGRALPLPVSAPFHCSLMAPALDAMGPALEKASFKTPKIPVISNVTAAPITDPTTIGKLLTRQIAETVQWQRSIEYAKSRGVTEWIVIGPSRVLGNLLRKEYPNDTIVSISNAEDILSYKKGEIIKS